MLNILMRCSTCNAKAPPDFDLVNTEKLQLNPLCSWTHTCAVNLRQGTATKCKELILLELSKRNSPTVQLCDQEAAGNIGVM